MKNIISMILICATFLISVPTVMANFDEQDMITINVVDKNNVPVPNARITMDSTGEWRGKWYFHANKMYTDRMGEIRLYDRTFKSSQKVSENVKYTVSVIMQSPNEKYSTEKFTLSLDNLKDGDECTIKLKGEDTKKAVEKSPNRVDFYVKNSKGKPIRNMQINLHGDLVNVPQGNHTDYSAYCVVDGTFKGYTDATGRLTFPNVDVDSYSVSFHWKGTYEDIGYVGGYEDKGDITVTNKAGVKTFNLTFDESQLLK